MAEDDWYALLKLPSDATTDQIADAVAKRSRQAASLANTAPERSQQLREQTRAIKRDLLSGDAARAAYDAARSAGAAAPTPAASGASEGFVPTTGRPRSPNRFVRFLQSGFTCHTCGESYLPGSMFCTQCRAQLVENTSYVAVTTPVTNPNACPYCGTLAASIHRYCRSCGAGRPAVGG